MAKVGNEVKLILRLAYEQAEQVIEAYKGQGVGADYLRGFITGMHRYNENLKAIILDLESK